jgi:magnesium transporter
MSISAYLYDAKGRDQQVKLTAQTLKQIGKQRLLWIDADSRDPAELKKVAKCIGLNNETLDDLIKSSGGRLHNYGNHIHLAVETAPAIVDMEAFAQEPASSPTKPHMRLDFVLSKDWLLTVHEGEIEFIREFHAEDQPETTIGSLTTHDFAASLLDLHLEAYFQEIARIEGLIDKLDEQALTQPSSRTLLGRMVGLRRRVSRLRTLLSAQRPVFYGLSRPDLQIVAEAGASSHFQILAGRFERAIDEVEHARDLVVGSFELFSSRTGQQTNELVKVLTYLTAVIGFCAAVAGVFGMNFETGFFKSGDAGFYFTIALLFAIIIVSAIVARWRKWL